MCGPAGRDGFFPAQAQSPLDGFNPGASPGVPRVLAVQPDGKILVGGNFTALGGGTGTTPRNRIGRLNPDGTVDTTFNPGANGLVVTALAVQPDGKILVGGDFTMLGGGGTGTTPRSRIGRLNADGSLDTTFDPGANGDIYTLAVQPDGKILVGGSFTMLGGSGTGTTPRGRIGRLNADGSLDTTFDPGANADVFTLAVQPDGKILVGGWFTMVGGGGAGTTPRYSLARLHTNGTLDTSFDPGANSYVGDLALQPDGKILVGGPFTMLGGGGTGTTARSHIGRLNADGSLDTTFNPGANARLQELIVQPDGKILVAGDFTALGGGTGTTTRNHLGRLHADGSLDTSFNPGANGSVYALALQADGKIVAAGPFTELGEGIFTTARIFIGRLHADGSLDTTLNPGANGAVYAVAVQPDGKILVGGSFTALGGGTGTTTRNRIGRLNADGTVDTTFNPGANGEVSCRGGAVRREDPGRRQLYGARRRDGHDDAQPDRATQRRRHGRPDVQSGRERTGRMPWRCSRTGRSWLAVPSRGWVAEPARRRATRIGRLNLDGSVDTTFNPGANSVGVYRRAAGRWEDPGWR